MLKKDLLDVLACPKCKLRYRVRNDIPDMLIEHAEKV